VRLEDISGATVRLAIELFLRHAYPGASRWRAPVVDMTGGSTARELLQRFDDESEVERDRRVGRFVLRLGNSRYPHMKLVLEESILEREYAFSVDTHDDLKVSPESPDYERWNAVRDHNRKVAHEIEAAWNEEGIPTLSDLKELMGAVEPITEERHSVLVVDDDPAISDTIRELLERAGLRVRTARNGKEALSKVAEEQPQLILMDYQMPEMDGVTCCEALKGDPDTSAIPVLLATRSQIDLASLTFADGFLVKPYRQDVLFSLVRKLLS
jgi:CheY-like chemotaxis protein